MLVHEPAARFLGEPTNGLDPSSARVLRDALRQICARGATVFMTTHILEIAEAMCDRVSIMMDGHLEDLGTLDELRALAGLPEATPEDLFLQMTGSGKQPMPSLYSQ